MTQKPEKAKLDHARQAQLAYQSAKPIVKFVASANEWLGTCPICGESYWGSESEVRDSVQEHIDHVNICFRHNQDEAWFALEYRIGKNRRQDVDDCLPEWHQYGIQSGLDF